MEVGETKESLFLSLLTLVCICFNSWVTNFAKLILGRTLFFLRYLFIWGHFFSGYVAGNTALLGSFILSQNRNAIIGVLLLIMVSVAYTLLIPPKRMEIVSEEVEADITKE